MIAALILLSSRKATRVLVLRSIQSNVVTMDNLRKALYCLQILGYPVSGPKPLLKKLLAIPYQCVSEHSIPNSCASEHV